MNVGKRIAVAAFAGLVVFMLVIAGGLAVAFRTDGGRAFLADVLESRVAGLEIGRLDGALPGEADVSGIVMSDARGPWLRIGRARLDWRPWALLSGRLDVATLEAWDAVVERPPQAGPPEPEDDAGLLPSLPLPVRIGRAVVHRLDLGPEVAGETVALKAEASLDATAARAVSLRANVDRLDREGTLRAVVDVSPRQVLTISATAHEPPGGLVSRLAGLPGAPAVSLKVEGEGGIADWKGTVAGKAGDGLWIDADVALDARGPWSMVASGEADIRGLAEGASWQPLAAAPFSFDLLANWQDGAKLLTVDRFGLVSPAFAAEMHGTLDAAAETVRAEATASVRDPSSLGALLGPASLAGARVTAQVNGLLKAPGFGFDIDVTKLAIAGATAERVRAWGTGAVEGEGVTLALGVQPEDLDPGSDPLRDLVGPTPQGEASIVFKGGDVLIRSVRIAGRNGALEASGEISADGALEMAAAAKVTALGAVLPAVGGTLAMDASIARRDAAAPVLASMSGELADLVTGMPAVQELAGDRVTFAGNLQWEPAGGLALTDLAMDGRLLALTGEAALEDDFASIRSRLTASVSNLAPLSSTLGTPLRGKALLDATASGPVAGPRIEANLTAPLVEAATVALRDLRVDLKADDVVKAPRGVLTLRSGSPWGPVQANGDFALRDGTRLAVSGLSAAVGDHTRLRGDLALALDGKPTTGALHVEGSRLAAWSGLAGQPLEGAVRLGVTLKSGAGGTQAMDATLEGGATGAGVTIGTMRVEAALSDVLGKPRGEVSVNAKGIKGAGVTALSLRGEGEWSGGRLSSRLTALKADAAGVPIELRQPVRVTYGEGVAVEGLLLSVGGGRLSGKAVADPGRTDVDLVLEKLPLKPLAAALGHQAQGILDAQVRVQGFSAAPVADFRLSLGELRVAAVPQAVSLDVQGNVAGGMLSAQAKAGGRSALAGEAQARLPVSLAAWPAAFAVAPDAPLEARARLAGGLGPITELLLPSDQRLGGDADIRIEAAGPLNDPRIKGEARLRNGQYENFTTGTVLRDLVLSASSDGQTVRLARAEASDGGEGRLSVQGSLGLSQERGFPIDLRGEIRKARLIRRDDASATLNGDLAISGGLAAPSLRGSLVVDGAEVRLIESAVPGVATLDVVELNGGRAAAPGTSPPGDREVPAEEPWAMALDVGVKAPRQVFVRGRGLESEWQGDVHVGGSTAEPRIEGDLRPVRGDFDLAGRRFVLEEGLIRFEGADEIDPRVDITAAYAGKDLRVNVRIEGRASDPKITLTSVPTLPQDEMLARLLFGKSASRLSALEAVQLAQALATLSGRGGAAGILDFARNTLGLDRVTVGGGDAAGGPALQVGKYVTDRVYVGVEQTASREGTQAQVEVELTPNLTLESDVGVKAQGNIGLRWTYDY